MAIAPKQFKLTAKPLRTAAERGYDAAHRKRRMDCLIRANYVCQCCGCDACSPVNGKACGAVATVADHIVPHRGDPRLLADMANHQGLCDPCHKAKTARGE